MTSAKPGHSNKSSLSSQEAGKSVPSLLTTPSLGAKELPPTTLQTASMPELPAKTFINFKGFKRGQTPQCRTVRGPACATNKASKFQ